MLSVNVSRVLLKIEGILNFIFAGLCVLGALVGLIAGAGGAGAILDSLGQNSGGLAALVASGGVIIFIACAICAGLLILFGIFYMNASKDGRKATPAFVLTIIVLVFQVYRLISGFSFLELVWTVWYVFVLLAALSMKKSVA